MTPRSKYADVVMRFTVKAENRRRAVFVALATKMHESITVGSPLTGSPGQPVDSGFLLGSWDVTIAKDHASIHTNVSYAPAVEYNDPAAYDPRGEDRPDLPTGQSTPAISSRVGGPHSVALTIASASFLQREAVRELAP